MPSIQIDGLTFHNAEILFSGISFNNAFESIRSEFTLSQIISNKRYAHTRSQFAQDEAVLQMHVGKALAHMKANGDSRYKSFLNAYGDEVFTKFRLSDKQISEKRGIYAYTVDSEVVYIGRCRDSFKKRINNGYGTISPRNVFLDGQATNCHLNSLIARSLVNSDVKFWVHPMDNLTDIIATEAIIIDNLKSMGEMPRWNIAVPSRK